jgi:2-aminoethylphosphonate aminotransferase
VLFAASGTGAVEACLSSVIPPERSVLIVSNGAYGKRMQEICDSYGIDHIDYNIAWGDPLALDLLRSILDANRHRLSHLAVVHHETTVGILNPLQEISDLTREHGIELIVDAMSSYAGVPIDLRQTPIDYLISSANKCIQGMAGVSFVICNRSALQRSADLPTRNYYFNLYRNHFFFEHQRQMQFTPPVQVLYALRQAINEYFVEGESERAERYAAMYRTMRDGLEALGFRLLVDEPYRAGILTAVIEPDADEYSFDAMHDFLKERGFTIYPGKGAREHTFRVANMGELTCEDIEDFLRGLREYVERSEIVERASDSN